MKRFFTLLLIALVATTIAKATTTTITLETADYQLIVDYSNAQGINQSDYPDNTDSYFGASSKYNNFDFRDGKWNVGGALASWEVAVQTAVSTIVLPAKMTTATIEDTISVYFKYYNGTATLTDFFVYTCTATDPLTFAPLATGAGSYKAEISAFTLTEQVTTAVIDATAQTITIMVGPGTNASALAPTIEISTGATINPASGASVDFTSPVTYTVTAEDGTTTKQWVVTVTVMEESITSIHDIQYVADPATSDVSPLLGETVIVKGLVTGFNTFGTYNKYYVQDGAGEWSGVYVYDRVTGAVLEAGDEVKLTGKVAEYYLVTELEASKVEILSSRNALPDPVVVTSAIEEKLEGVLVTVKGVTLSADTDETDSKKFILASNGSAQFKVFGELFGDVEYEEGKKYDLTGVVAYTYDHFRICPRGINDVQAQTGINDIFVNGFEIYPNPVSSVLTVKGIETEKVTIRNVVGQTVAVKTVSNNQINVSDLNNGVYFIESNNRIARFIKQ